MTVTRPKIFEPSIRLYDRVVHPEFFRIVTGKRIIRDEYEVALDITTDGHLITWTDGVRVLAEVACASRRELPENVVRCQELDRATCRPFLVSHGESYRNVSQLDEVPPDFFRALESEFLRDMEPDGMIYRFGFSGRTALGGVSYIGIESRAKTLLVRAVHTFPDDVMLLKTETKIRIGG